LLETTRGWLAIRMPSRSKALRDRWTSCPARNTWRRSASKAQSAKRTSTEPARFYETPGRFLCLLCRSGYLIDQSHRLRQAPDGGRRSKTYIRRLVTSKELSPSWNACRRVAEGRGSASITCSLRPLRGFALHSDPSFWPAARSDREPRPDRDARGRG